MPEEMPGEALIPVTVWSQKPDVAMDAGAVTEYPLLAAELGWARWESSSYSCGSPFPKGAQSHRQVISVEMKVPRQQRGTVHLLQLWIFKQRFRVGHSGDFI